MLHQNPNSATTSLPKSQKKNINENEAITLRIYYIKEVYSQWVFNKMIAKHAAKIKIAHKNKKNLPGINLDNSQNVKYPEARITIGFIMVSIFGLFFEQIKYWVKTLLGISTKYKLYNYNEVGLTCLS